MRILGVIPPDTQIGLKQRLESLTASIKQLTLEVEALSAAPAGSVTVEDEGVSQGTATTFDFTGAGVTATVTGGVATVDIPGGGGGGTPGGSTTQVQFNDGGAFGGDAGLVFNKSTNALTATGIVSAQYFRPTTTSGGDGVLIPTGTKIRWDDNSYVVADTTGYLEVSAQVAQGLRLNNSTFWLNRTTGNDAIRFINTGARLHIGAGTTDYLYSDGFGIVTPAGGYLNVLGDFTVGSLLGPRFNVDSAGRADAIRFVSGQSGGSSAYAVMTDGARWNIGTSANSYFYGNGASGIVTPGALTATGGFVGNASTATALNSTGSSGQFWAHDNTWRTPSGSGGGMSWLTGTATWDPPSLGGGEYTTTTVTVTGVSVGDAANASLGVALPAGMVLTAAVTAANTVTVTLANFSSTPQDLGSTTVYARVFAAAALSGSTTWDPASMPAGSYLTQSVTVTGAVLGDAAVGSLGLALPTGMTMTAAVTAADTVEVTLCNFTGTDQDLASSTLTARVFH